MDMKQTTTNHENINEMDLLYFFGHLLDNKWRILFITIAFSFMGVIYSLLSTPEYIASALIQVEKKSSSNLLLNGLSDILGNDQTDTATEVELLKSRLILGQTVTQLQLDNQIIPNYFPIIGKGIHRIIHDETPNLTLGQFTLLPHLYNQPLDIEIIDADLFRVSMSDNSFTISTGDTYTNDKMTLRIDGYSGEVKQRFILQKLNKNDVIEAIRHQLQIKENGGNTGILTLSYVGDDKAHIESVLNNIATNYLAQNIARKTEEVEKSLEFLQHYLADVKDRLHNAESQLNLYRQTKESIDLSLEAKVALDTMVNIEKQLNELTFKEAEIQQLYTQEHPSYLSLQEKRKTLLKAKEQLNRSIKDLPQTQQEILKLTRDVQVEQTIFVQLLNKQQELSIVKAGTIGNVRIIDDAEATNKPIKPKKALIVILSIMLGLISSVSLVLLRVFLRKGMENHEDIEKIGLPVFSIIPYSQEQTNLATKNSSPKKSQLLALANPADLAIEALRGLRTSLHFAMLHAKNNVIMVTGASPNIGKSFISVNFANILAMGNHKTLLIDADMRKGLLHQYTGCHKKRGLSDYLSEQSELTSIIQQTECTHFDIITCGTTPLNPAELLMHPNFVKLLNDVKDKYDYILIDTPPILAVTDAAIIGQYVDTTLFVARYRVTTQKEIEAATQRLNQNGISIKGVVFNAVERRASNTYSQYGYYNCNNHVY